MTPGATEGNDLGPFFDVDNPSPGSRSTPVWKELTRRNIKAQGSNGRGLAGNGRQAQRTRQWSKALKSAAPLDAVLDRAHRTRWRMTRRG
jgi:hypothetical protein